MSITGRIPWNQPLEIISDCFYRQNGRFALQKSKHVKKIVYGFYGRNN